MSVHYKFKSALDFDTITFDGLHINVADLKKAIIHQKRLGKNVDFDLQITNAQTKEEYNEDSVLIPKNTSLIIARIPLAPNAAKRFQNQAQNKNPVAVSVIKGDGEPKHVDLAAMDGSETDKINAMMHQSTADYDPTNYQKVRGGGQMGEVPPTYRCHRCHKSGHWIKNCPLGPVPRDMPEIKRSTGIPRSFIERDKNQPAEKAQAIAPEIPKTEVPEELICSICKDLFTDAVMIPCCGSSFCDECVRTALLESEDNECPDCQEKGTSPASLIPNRFLRRSVNNFKNETGYIVPKKQKEERVQESEEVVPEENTESNDFTEAEHAEPSEERAESIERHASHQSESSVPHETRKHDKESYPAEIQIASNHPHESQHYRESDEYAIRTTDPYHRQENKSDHPAGEPIRTSQIPSYSMQPIHPYPNQPYPHQGGPPMNPNFIMRPYNQHMQGYGRPQYFQHRGYGHGPGYLPRNRHAAPYTDVSTIYQGVAQQVGTGIIDDPLEAFNRIMREKERAKEEQARRRSPVFVNKYRRSRTPDRRRKRRSNSFEGSPIKRHFDRRVIDRKRRRSRSFSSSRSRSRSPPRKRSFTPRKYSKSPPRRSRSISQHNSRQSRNQRRDYRESIDRGVRKEPERVKSPLGSSRTKHKERHKSKTKEIKKKSRSRTPTRLLGKTTKQQSGDRQRRKSKERTPHNDTNKQPPSSKTNEMPNNVNNSLPLEFNDVLPPGVEAFDDESWQINDKYVSNKSQNNDKQSNSESHTHTHTTKVIASEATDKHEVAEGESKNTKDKDKDKKVNKDKKRRKKEKEKEKDVDGKKSKKHKREKSDRDVSQEKPKSTEEKNDAKQIETPETDIKIKALTEMIKSTEFERTLTPPLTTITKSDSVLDLYDNIDLDIFGDQSLNQPEDFLTLPEPSKWELEEKTVTVPDTSEAKSRVSVSRDHLTSVVMSAKELKSEKQHSKDSSPLSSAIVRPITTLESTSTVHNLKISVPAKSTNHSERSIELKSSVKHDKIKSVVSKESKDSKKPSIKDRLGEKVKEKSSDRRSSDHRTSSGKLASAALRNDGHKNDKDKDKDKDRSKSSRSHQSSHHNSVKVESKTASSRSTTRVSPSHKKSAVSLSKNTKPRSSSTSSSSSSESNENDVKSKRSKKEKKAKKKRSSKSSDESNTSLDKKKKSNKKKSKKEKKKKSKHKS